MSEHLIRASLDQALLAMDQPDTPQGAVHAAIAQALATLAGSEPQERHGPRVGSSRASSTFEKWRRDIMAFHPEPGLPDFKVEPKDSGKPVLVDPRAPGNPRRRAPIRE